MPIPLTYTEIEALFTSLGIATCSIDLPEGNISWLNQDNAVVATGKCQAILSWVGTNNSLLWAQGINEYQQLGVPCLPPPDDDVFQQDVSEEEAESLARQAAQLVSAQFLYDVKTANQGKLFLAIRNFQPTAS